MKKLYHYHEPKIGSNCGDCHIATYHKPMPVWPKALRFKMEDYEKAFQYLQGVNEFIQACKIPESCDKCPIMDGCKNIHGYISCHSKWRKIWEYVK